MARRGAGRRASGEGTLEYIESEKRWRARLTVTNPDGTTTRKTFTSKVSQEDVVDKRDRWRADRLGKGPHADPEVVTLSAHLDRWMSTAVKANVSPRTLKRYDQAVRLQIKPTIGALTLSELRVGHVEDLRDSMLASGLAPDTVRHALGVLSAALAAAARRGLLERNPASDVRRPKPREQMRALSEEEAGRLISAAERVSPRYAAMYRLALLVGPREGELLALRWSDLDAARRTLAIERTAYLREGGAHYGPTKSGKARKVKLPRGVASALESHRGLIFREMQRHQKKSGARPWEDPALMFPNSRGAMTRLTTHQRAFSRALREAGLEDRGVRFHDMRHTAATLMIRQGVPIPVVANVLGHSDPAMTLRRYSHVLEDMLDVAADRMDSLAFS